MNQREVAVPFQDLKAHHQPRRREFARAIEDVIEASAFAGGSVVERFEAQFAEFCGCPEAIGVGSGTEALWLVLQALGIGPGDEVITVGMTFMATAEAISMTGAQPVFIDVDERTFTMDPLALAGAVTPRTKAIIPVHLFGQAADMDPILQFARVRGLHVVEDAAQAHGARYKGRRVGTLGDAGCFSFYPGKNLGAFGDAGAVVTRDRALAHKIRMLRDHGQEQKYHHTLLGWNCRMDGIQAAVLEIKLRDLDHHNHRRSDLASVYDRLLVGVSGVSRPSRSRDSDHVFHLYVIRVEDRRQLIEVFRRRGIGYGIHYPIPVHLQEAYEYLGYRRGALPVSERCADQFVSLPMYPELTTGQIERVAGAVWEACEERVERSRDLPILTQSVSDLFPAESGR